jgi:hypothetical protein
MVRPQMNSTAHSSKRVEATLPDDLQLVPAAVVRRELRQSETGLWRADKNGTLPRLRIGHRAYYRLSDLRAFVNRAMKSPPVPVPWAQPKLEAKP